MTAHKAPTPSPYRILIINPNTSTSMTKALEPPIEALNYNNTIYTYFTNPSPSGPASINSPQDAEVSTETILPFLVPRLHEYDGFLVACFSPHPLVAELRRALISESSSSDSSSSSSSGPRKFVTGIFEASISAATEFVDRGGGGTAEGAHSERWVVVTTGEGWRESLSKGVGKILGFPVAEGNAWWDYREGLDKLGSKFGGVETTGLDAGELHDTPKEIVDQRMAEALGKVVDFWEAKGGSVGTVVLGCAGMVGWEDKIRLEMKKRFPEEGDARGDVLVIDPVKAGVGSLQSALRAGS